MTGKKYPSVKKMSASQQVRHVQDIFSTITGRYDALNHLFSLGQDVFWRRVCAGRMRFPETRRLLDVACGTGDLALEAARRYPFIQVTGLDFVREMMLPAAKKAERRGLAGRVRFLQGDARALPFADSTFDVAAVAFGMRNIPERGKALQEMVRVVVPGGQVIILEFTFPTTPLFRPIYYAYLNIFLPLMARALSTKPEAYAYLADSVMHFPPPPQIKALMRKAGLRDVAAFSLTFGITWLYVGRRSL